MNLRVDQLIDEWDRVETWRDLVEWPSYTVSSFGVVRGPRSLLTPGLIHGYEIVSLSRNGVVKNKRVHQIVIEAFIGPAPFNGALVAHNDGNRRNNRIKNLRWASSLENQADRKRHDTRMRGSDVSWSKLKEDDIPIIRERVLSGEKYKDIAVSYGVSVSTIHLIKTGKIWRHASGANWRVKQ